MLNKTRLLTPGPTPLPETVRLALARDMIHHRKGEFQQVMAKVQEQLRTLFGCSTPVLPLACTGTGAMTAAVYSLFQPGEKVLVINSGKFGQRWTRIALSRNLDVIELETPWGKAVNPRDLTAKLDENPGIKGVLTQVCETSTAVLQPIREIAAITRASDALLIADGISAVGISPCPMDEWGIDCLLTGSQKGLMLPPGLALIALSPRAWLKAENLSPGCFYFNLPAERDNLKKNQTAFTSAINLIVGLGASLDLLLGEGLEAVYRKQWALASLTRVGAASMGLRLFAPEHFAWGVTSILLSDGVDGSRALALAQEKYGVCMAGGQDQLKGRIVRLGHMGWVDWADCLAGLAALARVLSSLSGFSARPGYIEAAMKAYEEALAAPLPQL